MKEALDGFSSQGSVEMQLQWRKSGLVGNATEG
jgi:hypothetical protein